MKIPYSDKQLFIKGLIIFTMLVSPFFAKAQNKIADSLLKNLPASKADTNRVILLNKIAFALYTTDYQKSLAYCTQAGSLATKLHYLKGQALNSHIQGVVYTFKDDYATALIKEQQAASLALKTNDFALLAKAYNAAGLIYSRLNDSVRSLAAFNSAIDALTRTTDQSYHAAILHNMAVLYIDKKQFDRGLKDLLTAAELNVRNHNNQWLIQNYFWIGRVYYLQKQYPLALNYETKAVAIGQQYHYYQPLVKALGMLGTINIALKKYALAEGQLLQAEKIAEDKKIASERLAILRNLGDLYEQENHLKTALDYQKKYRDLYHATYNQEKAKLTAEYEARFQDRQKYIENELLKRDQSISNANIKQRNMELLVTLLIVVILIISTIVIYLAYYKIKQKNLQTEYQNKKIASQNAQLEELNQLKDKLFSLLAHDLRGPLATLKNLLELHEEGMIDKEEEETIRRSVMREVDQNSELINNLLIWGRSQLNGFVVSPNSFSLHELAARALAEVKSDYLQKNISAINNVPANLNAYADREMMDTVLRNLLSNAIKFTPAKGRIEIAATVSGHEVTVSVTDNGIGMPPEQAARLFKDDFYTTKTELNPKGIGLGLQICKGFVEKNNGKIWVESELGKGSTFYFIVPVGVTAPGEAALQLVS